MPMQHTIVWAGVLALLALWGSALSRHETKVHSSPVAASHGLPGDETVALPALDAPPERSSFAPAEQDPFAAPLPARPPVVVQAAPALTPSVVTHHAPTLNVRVVGRTLSADSPLAVYATDGAGVVVLSVGKTVSSGHRVSRVTEAGVELVHPLLNQPVVLPLPDYPKQEIR